MSAYLQVDDLDTCGLTAYTPGSAPRSVTSMESLYLYRLDYTNLTYVADSSQYRPDTVVHSLTPVTATATAR